MTPPDLPIASTPCLTSHYACNCVQSRLTEAERRVADLEAALRRYGGHEYACRRRDPWGYASECSCAWDSTGRALLEGAKTG